jgi:hypothetical protein
MMTTRPPGKGLEQVLVTKRREGLAAQQPAAVGKAGSDGACQEQVGLLAMTEPRMEMCRGVERLHVRGLGGVHQLSGKGRGPREVAGRRRRVHAGLDGRHVDARRRLRRCAASSGPEQYHDSQQRRRGSGGSSRDHR